MASNKKTIEYLLDQLSSLEDVSSRKMFGEYALYFQGKVVALVCDDQLYIKPTKSGKKYIGDTVEAPPYKGAKMYYLISADLWEDSDWLIELIKTTASDLPEPKPKKKKLKI